MSPSKLSLRLQSLGARLRDSDGFLGPVLTLVSGTAIAHGITALALLALARIYSPEDFGVLALYSSVVYTLSVAVCLRFEIAIVLPSEDDEALRLFWLALLASVAFATLSAVAVAFLPLASIGNESFREVVPFLWLLPINLLAVGSYGALQNWFVRKKAFGLLARSRVVQSAGAAGTQIGAGLASASPLGLIAGFIMNSGAATLMLIGPFLKPGRFRLPKLRELSQTFRKFSDFPRYSVWEALANSAAVQVPILLVGALTNPGEVGQLMLAMTVIQAPMALFGTATAQVFMAQAPGKMREGQLLEFTLATLKGLARTGCPVLLLLGIAAPLAFPILFGEEWTRAGWLVAWMTPWLMLQFLASPVSAILSITGRLRLAAMFQLAGLSLRLGMVWFGERLLLGASEAYSVSGAVFYGAFLYVILRVTRKAG